MTPPPAAHLRVSRTAPALWYFEVINATPAGDFVAGTCSTWQHAMTNGLLHLYRAYGLPLPERPESGVLV